MLLATYRVGSTKDSEDETIELCWSHDDGQTWSDAERPFSAGLDDRRGSLKCCYITQIAENSLIACSLWVDREAFPGKPLFNKETEGCLPMAIVLSDSSDLGATWSPWRRIPLPEDVGPPSLTSPLLRLPNGNLLVSVESNKHYLDTSKWFQKVVYLESADQGHTWGSARVVTSDPSGRTFNWDQRAAVAPDGQIISFTWTYDSETASYLNIYRRTNSDGGWNWSPPVDLGFTDQPSRPAVLPDGRVVLAWVDRFHTASIRARCAAGIDEPFDPASEVILYEHAIVGEKADDTGEMLSNMSAWSFGLPFAEPLSNGDVLVVYYAGSDRAMDIRYARICVRSGQESWLPKSGIAIE